MKFPLDRRRAIAPVIGTLIFLLVAIVVFVAFGSVIAKGLGFNQAAINAATILNDKSKESLVVTSASGIIVPPSPPSTPNCPPSSTNEVSVRNTGAVTSNVTFTFGVDTSGTLWTCRSPTGQIAISPGGNETFSLPSLIANGFRSTGVITSLGNTFYTDVTTVGTGGGPVAQGPGLPVVVGGSLFVNPGALYHFDVAANQLGDGYVLNGFAPWPTTGGISLNVGSDASGPGSHNYIIFKLSVKNLEATRTIVLNQFSFIQVGSAVSSPVNWYLAQSLAVESSPFTSGVSYNPFDPLSPPAIGPGITTTLYFAAPGAGGSGTVQDLLGTGVGSAAPITLALFGSYSDGSIFSGSANLGIGYYTCLNAVTNCPSSPGVSVVCHSGTSCPVVATTGNFGPFRFDISGFSLAPDVYWLNPGGTISIITGSKSLSSVTFSVPAGTSLGTYQIFVSDGTNFVDAPVRVVTTVTQPVRCTMDNGAPVTTLSLTASDGSTPVPSSVTCDGVTHNVQVDSDANLVATEPGDLANSQYRFSGNTNSIGNLECSSGTCPSWTFADYYQLRNTYQVTALAQGTFDVGMTWTLTCTQAGAPGSCSIASASSATVSQPIFVDYGRAVTFPTNPTGAPASSRWQPGPAAVLTTPAYTTSGNTYNVNYYKQWSNTLQVNPVGPGKFDPSLNFAVSGTSFGAATTLCTISTGVSPPAGAIACVSPVYADAGSSVTFPSPVSTWTATTSTTLMVSSGGGTLSVSYSKNVVVQQAPAGFSTTSSLTCTLASSVTSGHLLVMAFSATPTTANVNTITANLANTGFTQRATVTGAGATVNQRGWTYTTTASASGMYSITVTFTGSPTLTTFACLEIGISVSAFGTSQTSSGTSVAGTLSPSVPSFIPTADYVVFAYSAYSACHASGAPAYDGAYTAGTARIADQATSSANCTGGTPPRNFVVNQADEFNNGWVGGSTSSSFSVTQTAPGPGTGGWIEMVIQFDPPSSQTSKSASQVPGMPTAASLLFASLASLDRRRRESERVDGSRMRPFQLAFLRLEVRRTSNPAEGKSQRTPGRRWQPPRT